MLADEITDGASGNPASGRRAGGAARRARHASARQQRHSLRPDSRVAGRPRRHVGRRGRERRSARPAVLPSMATRSRCASSSSARSRTRWGWRWLTIRTWSPRSPGPVTTAGGHEAERAHRQDRAAAGRRRRHRHRRAANRARRLPRVLPAQLLQAGDRRADAGGEARPQAVRADGLRELPRAHARIDRDRRVADVETRFDPVNGNFNRLFATAALLLANPSSIGQAGVAKIPALQPFVVENIYTDFKRHDLGPAFHERNYDGTVRTEFLTIPLWGVGSTPPYGHDGRSINLTEVILRHGGEAQEAQGCVRVPAGKESRRDHRVPEFPRHLPAGRHGVESGSREPRRRRVPPVPARKHPVDRAVQQPVDRRIGRFAIGSMT